MVNVQKIKTSELRYRRPFEAAQDGILVLDVETGQSIEKLFPHLPQVAEIDTPQTQDAPGELVLYDE